MEDVRDSKECKQQAIEFDFKKNSSRVSCGLDDFRPSPSAYRDGFTSKRKRGFVRETGFSLPQRAMPLPRSKFFRMERVSISIP